jgi:hypothetical protein
LLRRSRLGTCVSIALLLQLAAAVRADDCAPSAAHWYKGNTHAHSVWSDADALPEMVADWYKGHGYHFLALSDHDRLMAGEKWVATRGDELVLDKNVAVCVPASAVARCQERFGPAWLQSRGDGDRRQVKLKTYDEVGAKLEKPGRFLMIPNEEITAVIDAGYYNVHVNALNLAEPIAPKAGRDVAEMLSLNLASVKEQAERLGRSILAVVNHPNFAEYDITAEDLAASAAGLVEICNGSPWGRHHGDATHSGVEKLWDIANTIRIAKMKAPPLRGIAADDAHDYRRFSPDHANPGRAWIMVRAKELSTAALIDAIRGGDFYASTGVVLQDFAYDGTTRTISVVVRPEPGVRYTIEFVGTLAGIDPTGEPVANDSPKSSRPGREYSPRIGEVLSTVQGTSASYTLTGKELYVRAVIRSDKQVPNAPTGGVQLEQAWCQPVGWGK